MKLIARTIEPESWSDEGGAGTMDYYPIGMSLIVKQKPPVHEKITELLATLRRQQDVEVAVEVRLIRVSDSFYDSVARHFFADGKKGERNALVCQPDTAFLTGTQAASFMEAMQQDRETSVIQAPKLTVFNGQNAVISVTDQQWFVTSVKTVQINGSVAFVPQNEPVATGTMLSIQPVISADRRYVHLNLKAKLTDLVSSKAPLFPVTTPIAPMFEGGFQGPPIPFTQFIQQPKISTLAVDRTVNIPDGGTVLLGGWKREHEVPATESGPPILCHIPFVNMLFEEGEPSRETETIMMMVTPRIIVQEETEVGLAAPVFAMPRPSTAPKKPMSVDRIAGNSILNNLDKLEQAEKAYRKAESYRRKGKTEQADRFYQDARRLSPGSRYDQLASTRLSQLHAVETPKTNEGGAEEQEPREGATRVTQLLDKYYQACAEGHLAEAKVLAAQALNLDPACFSKQATTPNRSR